MNASKQKLGYVFKPKHRTYFGMFGAIPIALLIFLIVFEFIGDDILGETGENLLIYSFILSLAFLIWFIRSIRIGIYLIQETKGNFLLLEGNGLNLSYKLPVKVMPFYVSDKVYTGSGSVKINSVGITMRSADEKSNLTLLEDRGAMMSIPDGWHLFEGDMDKDVLYHSFGRLFGGLDVEKLYETLSLL